MKLEWLGHAGFRITDEVIMYIDPYNLAGGDPADVILVTHSHFDHCSPADIDRVRKDDTVIVCPGSCTVSGQVRTVRPGDELEVRGVGVKVVPAYNIGKTFHPRGDDFVGYVIRVGDTTIYHAGDTDLIPEMEGIECDVALLPVSGTYVMTAKEAADAASRISTRKAVPMHYGAGVVGSEEDARVFERLSEVPVDVMERS